MSANPSEAAGSDFVDYLGEFFFFSSSSYGDFVFAAASALNLSSNAKMGRVHFKKVQRQELKFVCVSVRVLGRTVTSLVLERQFGDY